MKGHQMLAKLRKDENEEGFTLIELLVVVIIIGILAAIAIPVFLNQRQKAWDSAAKSDVKNMSTAQETYLTDENEYTTNQNDLAKLGFSPTPDVTHCADNVGGTSYVVAAYHTNSTNYFYFDSASGQLVKKTAIGDLPAACDAGSKFAPAVKP